MSGFNAPIGDCGTWSGDVQSVNGETGAVDLGNVYVVLSGDQSIDGEKTFVDKIIVDHLTIDEDSVVNNQENGDIKLIPSGTGGINNGVPLENTVFRMQKQGDLNLDQQWDGSQQTNQATFWQSFTAGLDGLLEKVSIFRSSVPSAGQVLGNIDIRVGEGAGGTLLASTTFDISATGWIDFNFGDPATVEAGVQYTMVFTITGGPGQLYHRYNSSGGYAGGRYSLSASWDMAFRTYVRGTFAEFVIKSDTGFVGVGLTNPTERLEVFGNIRVSGTLLVGDIKNGATQSAAGAAAGELWKTSGHATLPDNVLLVGV